MNRSAAMTHGTARMENRYLYLCHISKISENRLRSNVAQDSIASHTLQLINPIHDISTNKVQLAGAMTAQHLPCCQYYVRSMWGKMSDSSSGKPSPPNLKITCRSAVHPPADHLVCLQFYSLRYHPQRWVDLAVQLLGIKA